MSTNDNKIKDLLVVIEKKREEIGTKPKAAWKSNAVVKTSYGTFININTVTTIPDCVEVTAYVLMEQAYHREAAKLLDVEYQSPWDDYLEDLKLRASILKWDGNKNKLEVLEKKLKDLRSEDTKTADALSDILSELS